MNPPNGALTFKYGLHTNILDDAEGLTDRQKNIFLPHG